jgi:hypothetical protein
MRPRHRKSGSRAIELGVCPTSRQSPGPKGSTFETPAYRLGVGSIPTLFRLVQEQNLGNVRRTVPYIRRCEGGLRRRLWIRLQRVLG